MPGWAGVNMGHNTNYWELAEHPTHNDFIGGFGWDIADDIWAYYVRAIRSIWMLNHIKSIWEVDKVSWDNKNIKE